MFKKIAAIVLVVAITGAALWGFQHVRFFEKLPDFFQSAFASDSFPAGGQQHGYDSMQRNAGETAPEHATVDFSAEEAPRSQGSQQGGREQGGEGFGDMQRGGRGHGMAVSPAGWVNVMAYFTIFAFVVMLTYYGERGLCKVRSKG